jgi:predicted nucleic acid-binding protein
LIHLPEQIILPQAVAEEISAGPENDPARQVVEEGLFKIVETPSPPSEILAWDLGKGETAVLSFALSNPDWTAILDDDAARRCAKSFSLPIRGTLSVVILAKQYGLIESAARVLRALQAMIFVWKMMLSAPHWNVPLGKTGKVIFISVSRLG